MDRRTIVSSVALLGFVLMLVGTSKPRSSSTGPVPAPMPSPATADAASPDAGEGGSAGELGPSDASAPLRPDGGRAPRADGGVIRPGLLGHLELPPSWGDVAVPPGGEVDAVRLVHGRSDVTDVQAAYAAALTAKGWTLAQSADPGGSGAPGSARVMTFARKGRRLAVRFTPQDDAVIVSLSLL